MSNLLTGITGLRTQSTGSPVNRRASAKSSQSLTKLPSFKGFATALANTAAGTGTTREMATGTGRQAIVPRQTIATLTAPPAMASTNPFSGATTPPAPPPPAGFVPTPAGVDTTVSMATAKHHWYADDPVDDAYWAKQPPAVQQLRDIDDPDQRKVLATQLAGAGYTIDVPIMVWGMDAGKTMALRQAYGYSWVPSAGQNPIELAPGLSMPNMDPYDPGHPPPGSIMVG